MKKFTKLAAALLSAAMLVGGSADSGIRAAETAGTAGTAEETTQYAKLSYDVTKPVELKANETVTFQVEEVEKQYCYFTFSIAETSRIELTSSLQGSSASNLAWHFQGVYSDELCTEHVTELDAVDAGTYYARFECTPKYLRNDQTLAVSLKADSWNWGEGADGKSTDSAVSLTVGKDCVININEKYATRYVKFSLENDTVLTVQGNIVQGYSEAYMSVYDAKGVNITKDAAGASTLALGKPGEWSEAHKITLKAGTYYFGVSHRSKVSSSDFTFRTEILKETDNTPPAKPTKLVYKAGTTKVTGKGEKNATVFVRVGSKIYSGKISSKGTFSVKTAKLAKGDVVYVWVMDKALNQGKYSKVTVK